MNAALVAAATVVTLGLAVRPKLPARRPILSSPAEPDRSRARRGSPSRLRPTSADPQRRARAIRPAGGPEEVARWCGDLARACRSGSTLSAAVREVAPPGHAAEAVAGVQLALDRGVPLSAALAHLSGDRHLDLACTVLRACAEHGGAPAEPLDRAAATLRGRAADLAERRTQSAQARLSAVVMTWLPLVMLAVLLTTSESVRAATTRPAGMIVLIVGATLNLAGWRWMRRIIGAAG